MKEGHSPSLFLGLITYPGTRYPDASGSRGLVSQLAQAMEHRGWSVRTHIIDENLVDPATIDLSTGALRASIRTEFSVEADWRSYLRSERHAARLPIHLKIRRSLTLLRMRAWGKSGAAASKQGQRRLVRLANIEAAHLALLTSALESGCQWTLVLEDDAVAADVPALADALVSHLSAWDGSDRPEYVNMSESFSLNKLGIRHLMKHHGAWDGASEVLSAERPVTNTVCAILYRSTFVSDLHRTLQEIPLEPIVPIDWKLNAALMRLVREGRIGTGDCFTLEPAPIRQSSMH